MKISYWLVTYSGMGTHPALSFVGDFLLVGAPRSFGAAIDTIDIYARVSHAGPRVRNLASLAAQFDRELKTLPKAWFKRKQRRFAIAYASAAGTAEELFEREPGRVQRAPFARACQEVLALLPLIHERLKPGDRFDLAALGRQMEKRLGAIPATKAQLEATLARLRRARSPAKRPERTSTRGGPKLVTLDHDDHAAEHVGHTADGRQFFLTTPFVPAGGAAKAGREFLALYLFGKKGRLLSATIDDLGPRAKLNERARLRRRDELLASLGEVTFGRIVVAPFKLTRFGVEFGFIPRPPEDPDEAWSVTVEPGDYMCFWPPWTSGDYDT